MRIKVLGNMSRTEKPVSFEYSPRIVFDEDPAYDAYDWLVVYDELRRPELLRCMAFCLL